MIRAVFRSLVLVLAITAAGMLAGFVTGAAQAADNPKLVIDAQGRAVDGYDTVAYFTDGAAVPGDPAISYKWMGATWLFTSAEHRDMFAADPERYAPQFGGYCAYAISTNHAIKARPDVWSIYKDKLYLNVGPGAQEKWEKDVPGNVAKATNNWPGALNDPGRTQSVGATSDR